MIWFGFRPFKPFGSFQTEQKRFCLDFICISTQINCIFEHRTSNFQVVQNPNDLVRLGPFLRLKPNDLATEPKRKAPKSERSDFGRLLYALSQDLTIWAILLCLKKLLKSLTWSIKWLHAQLLAFVKSTQGKYYFHMAPHIKLVLANMTGASWKKYFLVYSARVSEIWKSEKHPKTEL